MKFFNFYQNNSGGYFIKDDFVDEKVIIQAKDHHEANDKALSLGIYFDGVMKGIDCECCGDRWNEVSRNDERTNCPIIENCKYYVDDEYKI